MNLTESRSPGVPQVKPLNLTEPTGPGGVTQVKPLNLTEPSGPSGIVQQEKTLRKFARLKNQLYAATTAVVPPGGAEDGAGGGEDDEEDSLGYEDDFSIGIDLPLAADTTSGIANRLTSAKINIPNKVRGEV